MQVSKTIVRSAKNALGGYSAVEVTIRDCTSNALSNPPLVDLQEIAEWSHYSDERERIIAMLEKRLNEKKGKNWRHVFKTLLVLEHLLTDDGHPSIARYFQRNVYLINTLKEFQYMEDGKRDRGSNVREKAREVAALLAVGGESSSRRPRAYTSPPRPSFDLDTPGRSRSKSEPAKPDLPRRPPQQRAVTASDHQMSLEEAIRLSEQDEAERQKKLQEQPKDDLFGDFATASTSTPQQAGTDALQRQQDLHSQFARHQALQTAQNELRQQQEHQLMTAMQQQAYYDELQRQAQMAYIAQQQQQMSYFALPPPQPVVSQPTGLNNPFAAFMRTESSASSSSPHLPSMTYSPAGFSSYSPSLSSPATPSSLSPFTTPVPNAYDEKHSELARALAQGTGMDTFGNSGEMRVFQHAARYHVA
ncbi:hypothetical protein JCM10212_006604 [Sporobolomyces blumeae]